MFKKLKQEEQLRIQKTRIELLERSLSNIAKYIRKDINDPIKEEEFLSGITVYPWDNMPVIGGEVTNIFINNTKNLDDTDYITIMYDNKYAGILWNYFMNKVEFPKKSINDIRYIITEMELIKDKSWSGHNDMLKITFTKIKGNTITVAAKDGSYENTFEVE